MIAEPKLTREDMQSMSIAELARLTKAMQDEIESRAEPDEIELTPEQEEQFWAMLDELDQVGKRMLTSLDTIHNDLQEMIQGARAMRAVRDNNV